MASLSPEQPVLDATNDLHGVEIRLLRDAARLLAGTLRRDQIFDRLQGLVASVMDCNSLVVSSFDHETQMVSCEYAWMDGERTDPANLPPVKLAPEGRGMQSAVIHTGKPLIIEDAAQAMKKATIAYYVEKDGTHRETPDPTKPFVQSILMVPLLSEGRVVGVVQVMGHRLAAYGQRERQLLESVVSLLAIALQNADLYEARRRSQRELQIITDVMPTLISYVEPTLRYRFVNRQYETWFGIPRAEVVGKSMAEVLGDDAFAKISPFVKRALAGHTVEYRAEVPYQTAGLRAIDATYIPDISDSGKVEGLFVHVADVTQKYQAELALVESEERFRNLAEHSPNVVWMTDEHGTCTYMNKEWTHRTGQSVEDSLDGGWFDMVHPDDVDHAKRAFREGIANKQPIRTEYRLKQAGGGYRWSVDTAAPRFDEAGRFLGHIGSVSDIHDQRLAAEEMEKIVADRTAELQASHSELEGFTYSVSHDLRAPLRAMMSASMILLEDHSAELSEAAKGELARMARAAGKMGKLIDDLLQFSRLGRAEVSKRTVDLSAMASEVASAASAKGEGNVTLVQPGMVAEADPPLLRLVLENLIDNAIKYSSASPEKQVEIGSETHDGETRFFVADRGVGFDMQYAHKLFRPFERLHADSAYPGTGIGLANVRRIIEKHGGRVWAEAEVNKGARFYFTLA